MVESATGLVEHVLPQVAIRQWVLSFQRHALERGRVLAAELGREQAAPR